MIRLQPQLFQALASPAGLLTALQTALELEHATIPPYLISAYSLKPENVAIRDLVLDVAYEEMLHMTLVCNLINALGGAPQLNSPDFIPKYPTNLPGAVHDDLIVPLAPFSLRNLETVFLRIEEPEKPRVFPGVSAAMAAPPQTIGQFYSVIKDVIRNGGDVLFTGDPQRQISRRIRDDRSTKITDAETAIAAIDLIVEQGEGTDASPLEGTETGGEPAHYYRFLQILKGRTLRADNTVPEKFSYSGDPIVFDPAGVFPVQENLRAADIPADSEARALVEAFNRSYTQMLGDLHRGFNGEPARLNLAVNAMVNTLGAIALQLVQMPLADGRNAGPTFEFAPLD